MKDLSQLPAHSHCATCGRTVILGKLYCSKECESRAKKDSRKKGGDFITRWALVAMLMIALLLTLYSAFR